MKKTLFLNTMMMLILVLVGCVGDRNGGGNTPANAKKRYKIVTVVKADGLAWFDRMEEGINRFAAEMGHEAVMIGPARPDGSLQAKMIEDLIEQGEVDAIVVVPFSVNVLEPILKKAREQGIVVIAHEASNQVNADYIIEPFDNAAYGRHLMDHLAENMGYTGEYVVFVGSLDSKSHNEWVDAAIAHQQEQYPNMKLITGKIEDFDDQATAYVKTVELLKKYPHLAGIQTSAMPSAAGAGLAVEEAGLVSQISVVGTSLVSVSGDYLESNAVRLISFWDPADAGYVMNELAVDVLEGTEIKEGLDLGVKGYRHIRIDENKPNLLFGEAWVDVTKENMFDYPF